MKKIILVFVFTISMLIMSLYPTHDNIYYGHMYNINQKPLSKGISFEISPKEYNISNHKSKKPIPIYNYGESTLYLDKVITTSDYIEIVLSINTNWNILSGNSLSINKINENGYGFSNITCTVTDIKNNDYLTGLGLFNESIFIRFDDKEKFYNSQKISIELNGLLKTAYSIKYK